MDWYLIHTKPRQEQRALAHLTRQGFQCVCPMITVEKLARKRVIYAEEPLFPRYLFIALSQDRFAPSWAPIRSTLGVSRLVCFGDLPAKVPEALVETLSQPDPQAPAPLYTQGQVVRITEGPFAGMEALYQIRDGDARVRVLIELLQRPALLSLEPAQLVPVRS